MQGRRSSLQLRSRRIVFRFALIVSAASSLLLAAPLANAAMYLPGATLDPACAPTAANCGIETAVASSTADSVPYYAANGGVLSATSTFQILPSGTARATNLTVGNSLVVGTLSGFLKATAGVISTALVNLASDVTGILPVSHGGTGLASVAQGFIPFGNGAGALATSSSLYWNSSNGRLGIGTTSPSATLAVGGSGYFTGVLTSSGNAIFGTGNTTSLSLSGGSLSATVQALGAGANLFLRGSNGESVALQSASGRGIAQFFDAANGSAVNYFLFKNAAAGSGPLISAIGSDANVNANYSCQGSCSHVFNNTVQAPTMYVNQRTVTFSGNSGNSQPVSQFGFDVNENLVGSSTAGNINANTITVNKDSVIPAAGQSVNWLQINGSYGNPSWKPNTAYQVGNLVDWEARTYSCVAAGTSASSGGPTGTGSNISDGTAVWAYQGPSWGGSRAALFVYAGAGSQSSSLTDADKQIQSALFTTTVSANQGGVSTTNGATRGYYYGSGNQMWAQSGATDLSGVIGNETDVGVFQGASTGQRVGMQVVGYGDVQGSQLDVGYRLGVNRSGQSATTRAPGFKVGFGLDIGAIDPAGSILSYLTPIPGSLSGNNIPENPPKIAYGIDLMPYLVSGAAFRSAGGFLVDGNGGVNIGSARLNATSSGLSLNVLGSVVTNISLNTSQVDYVVGDQLSGPYGSIITVTAVDSSGRITAFTTNVYGGTTLSNPQTTGVSFTGGSGLGATFNLVFSTGHAITLDPTGGGNVAIGTTTPYSRLSIWGPGKTASTSAFLVANSASTTEFYVLDNGNAMLAGTLTQNSDYRLKQDITPLSASSTLSAITSLTPVSFIWRNASEGSTTQFGLIAQDVQKIFPNLVSTTSATALTPGGTLGVNYIGLIAPAIEAIKELAAQVMGFAQSITTNVLTAVTGNFTQVKTQNLCLGSTCITESQLKSILSSSNQSAGSLVVTGGGSSNDPSVDTIATSTASTSPANVEHATSTPEAATSTQATTNLVAPPPRIASTTSPTTSSSTASH